MEIRKGILCTVLWTASLLFLISTAYLAGGKYDIQLIEPLIRSIARNAKISQLWWNAWIATGQFIYIIGNAFAEEIVFLGPLLLLRKTTDYLKIPRFAPLAIASVVISAIYALLPMHDTLLANVVTFGLGLFLSAVVCKTGKFMPAVLIHAAWTFAMLFINPQMY